jgi:hypothetical protein
VKQQMAEGKAVLNALKSKGYNVKPPHSDDDEDEYVIVKLPRPSRILQLGKLYGKQLLYLFRNGLWPATPNTLITVTSLVTFTTVAAERDSWLRSGWVANLLWNIDEIIIQRLFNPFHIPQPIWFRVAYLASSISFISVYVLVWIQRLILRFVLSFTSFYLFRSPTQRNPPWEVRMWGSLVRILSGSTNMTYAFQPCLPRLPVPSLQDTIHRYLESMEPLIPSPSFDRLQIKAKAFLTSPTSTTLQRYLLFRRFVTCTNYVTPWWEKYVYLSMRDSLAINSSYYVMDCVSNPVHDQVFRAANLLHHMVKFQRMIETEQLKPLMLHDTVPLCMDQYKRVFGTTRIPKRDVDILRHIPFSRHVVVVRRSRFYKLKTIHDDGSDTILTPAEFAHQLRVIMEHANMDATKSTISNSQIISSISSTNTTTASPSSSSNNNTGSSSSSSMSSTSNANTESYRSSGNDVMVLTTLPRPEWARIRDQHFTNHEENSTSLECIETASFILHLDYLENVDLDAEALSPRHSTRKGVRRARALFHGRSDTLFFDKSLNLVVFDDGVAGLTVEHAGFDAPVTAHVWEHVLLSELIDVENDLDASSRAGESLRGPALPVPTRFSFFINDAIRKEARRARRLFKERINDVDLEILAFDSFGQTLPKSYGISPDSFVQMALQLAYYFEQNRFDLTYESCTTKLFCEGRTETIRTVTKESCAFVHSCVHLMNRFVNVAWKAKSRKWGGKDDDVEMTNSSGRNNNSAARRGVDGFNINTSSSDDDDLLLTTSNLLNTCSREELQEIEHTLRIACERHQVKSRAAMAGMGCDRHLFALYLASKGINKVATTPINTTSSPTAQNNNNPNSIANSNLLPPSPKHPGDDFLEIAMGSEFSRWRLSTSQQPQHQTSLRELVKSTQVVEDFISPGGGFGPIEDDGYGVAYTFGGQKVFFFHITAKKKANPITDARRFAVHVRAALLLMGEILLKSGVERKSQ